jgi:hypothetical protein
MRCFSIENALHVSYHGTGYACRLSGRRSECNIGAISSWKVKDGQPFKAGDVLLSIETDKAEIDVEVRIARLCLQDSEWRSSHRLRTTA